MSVASVNSQCGNSNNDDLHSGNRNIDSGICEVSDNGDIGSRVAATSGRPSCSSCSDCSRVQHAHCRACKGRHHYSNRQNALDVGKHSSLSYPKIEFQGRKVNYFKIVFVLCGGRNYEKFKKVF